MAKGETPLLRAKEIIPTSAVVKSALGEASFEIYNYLIQKSLKEFELAQDWYYYKDQKNWLCKLLLKKRNIFWVAIFENYFKITFYFTERYLEEFNSLKISVKLKKELANSHPIGKLFPLTVKVESKESLKDILTIIAYKVKQ